MTSDDPERYYCIDCGAEEGLLVRVDEDEGWYKCTDCMG